MSTPSASRSEPRERVALARLSELKDGARVAVRGRVLARHAGSLVVEDESGRAEVFGTTELAPGELCSLHGEMRAGRLHVAHAQSHGGGEGVFAQGSDYVRLHAHGPLPLFALRERARLMRLVRGFFEARDYLEVDTPLAVPSPGLDLHLSAFEVGGHSAPRYLITSPEYQMKRLLSAGAERVYQIARCFRSDESGPHHEPEFSMLEWYQSHSDMAGLMDETETLVRAVAQQARPEAKLGADCDATLPFERITVREAFRKYANADSDALAERDPDTFYRLLVERVEPELGRLCPTFLSHYPASMASLARLDERDPRVAHRFELYAAGVELCNGFFELTCPREQRQRLERDQREREAAGLPAYPIDERFLRALEDGIPPCAGNALGLDRLFMLALGLDDIQALCSFPDAQL